MLYTRTLVASIDQDTKIQAAWKIKGRVRTSQPKFLNNWTRTISRAIKSEKKIESGGEYKLKVLFQKCFFGEKYIPYSPQGKIRGSVFLTLNLEGLQVAQPCIWGCSGLGSDPHMMDPRHGRWAFPPTEDERHGLLGILLYSEVGGQEGTGYVVGGTEPMESVSWWRFGKGLRRVMGIVMEGKVAPEDRIQLHQGSFRKKAEKPLLYPWGIFSFTVCGLGAEDVVSW